MDWVYLILILAFLSWCVQIVFAYRRQVVRFDDMIQHATRMQEEVTCEADRQETQAQQLREREKELEARVSELEGKETDLQGRLTGRKEAGAARNHTRHRVDGSEAGS